MSYSYVKTVFPDFQHSSVYDDKLYNNINETQLPKIEVRPYDTFSPNQALMEVENRTNKIETFDQEIVRNAKTTINHNTPIVNNDIPNYNNIDVYKTNIVETFNDSKIDSNHDNYMYHATNCEICKQKLLKQWNVDNDRLRNEEILELISYVMLGLFILMLLDSQKQ